MVSIVLSCAEKGCELAKQSVCMQCDNFSVVTTIKKGLPEITQSYTCWGAFGFYSQLWHTAGPWTYTRCFKFDRRSSIKMPDASSLFTQSSHALSTPSAIHPAVLEILNPHGVDWTSLHFHELLVFPCRNFMLYGITLALFCKLIHHTELQLTMYLFI